MLGFLFGFLLGAALGAVVMYYFYHINVVKDLQKIIEELKKKIQTQ